ncbi:Smr/MutS family protein [Sphingomonas lutea]|uniref:Smr/MutS family protein n=1 Tax=Sphingomonas lutea TaxID=1045317 RepID=UPI002E217CAC
MSLSAEEAELWARVTGTIRPLSRERIDPPRNGEGDQPKAGGVGPPPPPLRRATPPPSAPRPVPLPVPAGRNTLDGSWDKKLRSGSVTPDRVVDLHGLNLDQAWTTIDRAIEQAIDAGDRVVLLITGHHRPGEPPIARGRIRAAVHDWLAASRHAPRIAAVRGAHVRHGGGGSLYLILRRR